MASHEITIFSYHLRRNLWLGDDVDMMMLGDDISVDLDVSLMVRREGFEGPDTPDGILTKFKGTNFENIISQIEQQKSLLTLDLGFFLLNIDEYSAIQFSNGLNQIIEMWKSDAKCHDFTLGFGDANSGVTIHCNLDNEIIAAQKLKAHCKLRKYSHKAKNWFGICISPLNKKIRFGIKAEFEWRQDDELDAITDNMPQGIRRLPSKIQAPKRAKVGRNAPCICGSGLKYKKCCLNKDV